MPRSTKPWVGKTDNSMPPPRVRQRVFDRAAGVCHWCKLAIKVPAETWQADHVHAIINGGKNEEANLAPIHGHCHVEKTGQDLAQKKKTAAIRQKFTGAKRPAGNLKGPGFPKTQKAPAKPCRPPRPLYRLLRKGELAEAGQNTEGD